jgi:hypothetical protein
VAVPAAGDEVCCSELGSIGGVGTVGADSPGDDRCDELNLDIGAGLAALYAAGEAVVVTPPVVVVVEE